MVAARLTTVYLDMSKAFDKASHRRIVHQLIQAGFGGNLLNWFCSYLSSRRQRVTVLGATLEDLPVTSGVPQGSILGPALFLLYVNDLKLSVLAVECSCSLTNKNIQSDKDFGGCLFSPGRPWEACNLVSVIWSPF